MATHLLLAPGQRRVLLEVVSLHQLLEELEVLGDGMHGPRRREDKQMSRVAIDQGVIGDVLRTDHARRREVEDWVMSIRRGHRRRHRRRLDRRRGHLDVRRSLTKLNNNT